MSDMNESSAPMREMPRYVSCKTIWALKIARIEQAPADQEKMHPEGDYVLHFAEPGYGPKIVGADWVAKRGAKPGGYYIVYEGDGYTSWSPAEAFERSSIPAAEWGIPRTQETKYGVNLRGKLFNRATGAEVDEPVFVLRAQDRRALPFIVDYRQLVAPSDMGTQDALDRVILLFSTFSAQHPERMKDGDTKSPPPAPFSMNPQRWSAGEREA